MLQRIGMNHKAALEHLLEAKKLAKDEIVTFRVNEREKKLKYIVRYVGIEDSDYEVENTVFFHISNLIDKE